MSAIQCSGFPVQLILTEIHQKPGLVISFEGNRVVFTARPSTSFWGSGCVWDWHGVGVAVRLASGRGTSRQRVVRAPAEEAFKVREAVEVREGEKVYRSVFSWTWLTWGGTFCGTSSADFERRAQGVSGPTGAAQMPPEHGERLWDTEPTAADWWRLPPHICFTILLQ